MKSVPLLPSRVFLFSALLLRSAILTGGAAPGDTDLSFALKGASPGGAFWSAALQGDGKIIAITSKSLLRYLPDGTLDTTFAAGTGRANLPLIPSGRARSLALQPDGRILVAGSTVGSVVNCAVARFTAEGRPDTTFGPGGVRSIHLQAEGPQESLYSESAIGAVVVLPDGSVLAGGALFMNLGNPQHQAALWRLSARGETLEASVMAAAPGTPGSLVITMAPLPNGDVFMAGVTLRAFSAGLYRYQAGQGTWTMGYLPELQSPAPGLYLQPASAARTDGTVVVTGSRQDGENYLATLKRAPGGSEWRPVTPPVISTAVPGGNVLLLQEDGSLFLGHPLSRLRPDGGLDPAFRVLPSVSVNQALRLPDGKILASGGSLWRLETGDTAGTLALEEPAGTPAPATADFGTLSVPGAVTRVYTVRNTGTLPLPVYQAAVQGVAPAGLSVRGATFPFIVPAGGSATFDLRWAPSAPGALDAAVRLVTGDSARRETVIPVSGLALAGGPEIGARWEGLALTSGGAGGVRLSPFRPRVEVVLTSSGTQALHADAAELEDATSSFTLESPLPATLEPGGTRVLTLRYTPGDQPVASTLRIPSDDPDENPFVIPLTGDPSTYSADWRKAWFNGTTASLPSGDKDDPDGDGLPNLMEYATFANPLESGGSPGTLTRNGDLLEYTITRPQAAAMELLYALEWTDNLAAGPWKTQSTGYTILNGDSFRQTVKFTAPAGTSAARYVRLRVTRIR